MPTPQDILTQLVLSRDRSELQRLGAIDDFPIESAWINFVAPRDDGEGGKYFPDHEVVEIYRDGCPPSPGSSIEAARQSANPLLELIWLAHELGHHESNVAGLAPPVGDSAPEALRYEEEVRAWDLGKRILSHARFSEWHEFESVSASGLAGYKRGLGLSSDEALAAQFFARHPVDEHTYIARARDAVAQRQCGIAVSAGGSTSELLSIYRHRERHLLHFQTAHAVDLRRDIGSFCEALERVPPGTVRWLSFRLGDMTAVEFVEHLDTAELLGAMRTVSKQDVSAADWETLWGGPDN